MNRILVKLIIVLSFICLALPLNCFAMGQQSSSQEAVKFDEFGDIYLTDIKARLDNFSIQLQNQPNTRAFIIVYRSRRDLPGLSSRLASRIKAYLIEIRRFPTERVVMVDGGVASCVAQELWIVPVGATPTPRKDVYLGQFIDTDSAWKFDEYYYALPKDWGVDEEGYVGNSLEAYTEALRKYPRTQAYIILYPQYYVERLDSGRKRESIRRVHIEPPSAALKALKSLKAELVTKYSIAPSRIKIVNGGYRKQSQVELWIVPRGEHAPIATPNAFPKKHR